jgi:Protein of unknown function (DUF1236)
MMNRLMITAATAALIAGTGFANAQGMGGGREGGAAGGGAGMQQSAPSAPAASPSAGAPGREGASEGMKSSQSQEKGGAVNRNAQQDMKSGPTGEKTTGEKSAQDNNQGERSKNMNSQNDKAGGKDMKAEGREERNGNMKADGRDDRSGNKAEGRDNNNTAGAKQEDRSHTVGQAGAGGKMTTEQRTKITTVIRDQHIAPVTNVNFAVSVGTRVPREVGFHPLPTEIVAIYPDWRDYQFCLVREQIIVVDPRTLEIVAVLDT